jgi:hypothetical protein
MNGNGISNSVLLNSRSTTVLAAAGLSWAIQLKNILKVGDRLIVENKPHAPLRSQLGNALTGFFMRQQLAIGVGQAAADLGHLYVGQSHVVHVFDIVEQRAGSSILLGFGQLFDLAQGLFEQLCHRGNLARRPA